MARFFVVVWKNIANNINIANLRNLPSGRQKSCDILEAFVNLAINYEIKRIYRIVVVTGCKIGSEVKDLMQVLSLLINIIKLGY